MTATCPVCQGTTRVPAGDRQYKHITQGYDPATDTLPCRNCGGQYQNGSPTGLVRTRPDGTPCAHAYRRAGIDMAQAAQ